jgi:hypothetical protein
LKRGTALLPKPVLSEIDASSAGRNHSCTNPYALLIHPHGHLFKKSENRSPDQGIGNRKQRAEDAMERIELLVSKLTIQ